MQTLIQQLTDSKYVPVLVLKDVDQALATAQRLVDKGLGVAEVTFRTPAAADSIAAIRAAFPQLLVGAGTILTLDELHRAAKAGATFCVAPGYDPTIVAEAQKIGMPFIPGIATASELSQAYTAGCKMVKFFPAQAAGGIPLLKSLMAAFGHCGISVMPTGGITAETAPDWFDVKGVVCVGGSWMA